MAIKAGQFLHSANGFVIDRIQTGGVSNLNIPQEKIYELGNEKSVETIRDIPDLSFDMESFDVSCEVEALLTGQDSTSIQDGDEFDFLDAMPLDVISPFKSDLGAYDIVKGISVPYLSLESASYRFGVRQSSAQTFTLKGDAVHYIPGTPYRQRFTITSGTNQQYTLSNTAIAYVEQGNTLYALSVCARNETTKKSRRLFFGDDYTNSSTVVTVLDNLYTEGYTALDVIYGSTTAGTYGTNVHSGIGTFPGAIRGKDVCVYISDGAATPNLVRWTGVQSAQVDWRVTLEPDEELCNPRYVTQDYDVPEVSGNVVLKSSTVEDLWAKIAQVANVQSNVVAGPYSSQPLEMEIRINHPETGNTLKTLYVPDARFVIPNMQGQVQQKLNVTINFSSDGGTLLVYSGERP